MADIHHAEPTNDYTHAFNLGYHLRGIIDDLLSDPLESSDSSDAAVAVAHALIDANPSAPSSELIEAIFQHWVDIKEK